MEQNQTHGTWSRAVGRVGVHLCRRHKSPLNTYCCTDEQVICASCASTEHRGHTFGLVREERRRKQNELKRLKRRCQELQQQDRTNALVQEKAREMEDFCEAVLTEVIDLLQTQYMSVRKQIQALESAALSAVQAQGAAEMKRRCSQLDRLARTNDDVHFLLDWPSVCQLIERDLTEFSDELRLPFQSLQNTVDSFGNQLKEFCNKGFTTMMTNNAPGFDRCVLRTEDDDDDQQTDSHSDAFFTAKAAQMETMADKSSDGPLANGIAAVHGERASATYPYLAMEEPADNKTVGLDKRYVPLQSTQGIQPSPPSGNDEDVVSVDQPASLSEKFVQSVKIIVIHLLNHQIHKSWKEECYGCQVDHPSQKHHSCLYDFPEYYFQINFDKMMKKLWNDYFTAAVSRFLTAYGIFATVERIRGAAEMVLFELKQEENIHTKIDSMYSDVNGDWFKTATLDVGLNVWRNCDYL